MACFLAKTRFSMPRSEASTLHPGRFAIETLLHPLEIHMGMHKRAVRQREDPVFDVMVRVDNGEHGVAHMPHLIAAGSINQIELHRLSIRWGPSHHMRPVAEIA